MTNPKTATKARARLGVSCGVRCGWRLAAKLPPTNELEATSKIEGRTEVEGRGPIDPRKSTVIDRHQTHRSRDRWRMSPAATWARHGRRMVAWSCFVLAFFEGAAHSENLNAFSASATSLHGPAPLLGSAALPAGLHAVLHAVLAPLPARRPSLDLASLPRGLK